MPCGPDTAGSPEADPEGLRGKTGVLQEIRSAEGHQEWKTGADNAM